MDLLKKYKDLGFTGQRLREIEKGLRNGLTEEQVDRYAKTEFDNLQMREIREGLEEGLDDKLIDSYAIKESDALSMNHYRVNMAHVTGVTELNRQEILKKKLKNTAIAFYILLGVVAAAISGYFLKDTIHDYLQPLDLQLVSEEITVPYGSSFSPMDYVGSYTQEDNVELILPDPISTEDLADKEVMYKLKNGHKVISKTMIVHVTDETAPVLSLTKYQDELVRGKDSFLWKNYIANASDNVDGDLEQAVTATDMDPDLDMQTITYSVTDSSGNIAEAELELILKDPEPVKEPEIRTVTEYVYVPAPAEPESVPQPQTEPQPVPVPEPAPEQQVPVQQEHGTKYFWFSEGYDIDTAFNACVAAGSSHGAYSCEPMMDQGLYTGYLLTY